MSNNPLNKYTGAILDAAGYIDFEVSFRANNSIQAEQKIREICHAWTLKRGESAYYAFNVGDELPEDLTRN